MKCVIAQSGIVPVRADKSDKAEMVTQMLVGETADVLDVTDRWMQVVLRRDYYEGWISISQVTPIDLEATEAFESNPSVTISPYASFKITNGNDFLIVPPGAPIIEKGDKLQFPFGDFEIVGKRNVIKKETILETAKQFLGTPYLWGGRTDSGIDCSGFIQTVLALHGLKTGRDARDQIEDFPTEKTNSLAKALSGDLIYFSFDGVGVQHVGFYLGDGLLLHAGGSVKIEIIDSSKRFETNIAFNERLANHICGVQKIPLIKV